MTKTISKTFRLPAEIVKEIEEQAAQKNISQGQYFVAIFTENKFLKMHKVFEENLIQMEQDKIYQQEQRDLAEADFL